MAPLTRGRALALIAACAAFAACASDERKVCADVSAPGVVIQSPGLDVTIRDAGGRGRALGTTVGGTDTVTAIAVADTNVRGKTPVVVTKQIGCS